MKNKKSLSALISLAAIVLVVGTLAYFSRDLTVENRLKTAKYDTTIEEEFIPTDKWAPGVEINKKVTVKNTGNVDIVVRAKLTELWKRSENLMDPNDPDKILSEEGKILPNSFVDENGISHDAAIKNFVQNMVYEYEDVKDNLADYHNKWIHYGDYYYYLGVIGEDEASNGLLNSVKMNPLLDATVSGSHTVVEADEQGTTTVTKKYQYGKYGYDSADYTLTVDARTVQASKAAIRDAFGDNVMAVYLADHFATIAEQQ